jgi:hypothetical protein
MIRMSRLAIDFVVLILVRISNDLLAVYIDLAF